MKKSKIQQIIKEEIIRLNEDRVNPQESYIKTWADKVVNPGESYNQYDDKSPREWNQDDFKTWVVDHLNPNHEIVNKEVLLVTGLPKNTNIIEYLNEDGSGLNQNREFNKYNNWRAALYDIWFEIQDNIL